MKYPGGPDTRILLLNILHTHQIYHEDVVHMTECIGGIVCIHSKGHTYSHNTQKNRIWGPKSEACHAAQHELNIAPNHKKKKKNSNTNISTQNMQTEVVYIQPPLFCCLCPFCNYSLTEDAQLYIACSLCHILYPLWLIGANRWDIVFLFITYDVNKCDL